MKAKGKRPAHAQSCGPSKKRRLATLHPRGAGKARSSKERASPIKHPIPVPIPHDDVQLSDQDLDVFHVYGDAASFLNKLDSSGIARIKREADRLYHLNKPVREARIQDDLPSIDSDDEDDGEISWDSIQNEGSYSSVKSDGASSSYGHNAAQNDMSDLDSDTEMPYESFPRKRRNSWDRNQGVEIPRLPIKLPDGRIKKSDHTAIQSQVDDDISSWDEGPPREERKETRLVDDLSTGARFGHPAVIDIIGKARIQEAKEEIANICRSIVAEPENSLGLLRRLHVFSLPKISSPSHPNPVENHIIIRKLAILSQLAVFKDIIPGYRIRPLTDAEKADKVSQQVARTREWEQGLIIVYQSYLRSLDSELKAKSGLVEVALRCICTLAVEVTHFNFNVNLMSSVVTHLSRKSWDKSSELCLSAIIQVFRSDLTGIPSLEIVRLLNRMIKEKRFDVHPKVLSCLVHLRLKTELKTTSETRRDDALTKSHSKGRAAARRAKGKFTNQPHMSKKARKGMKEQQEIDRELRDAEAEVDKEERDARHTKTLQLLFALYFRILKNPHPNPLLPAALQGISKFAHLVNVDFFEDLMKVLKNLIARDSEGILQKPKDGRDVQHRLLCIVAAFELLSGQGEALNIDLTDFVTELYAIILPLSLMVNIGHQSHSSSEATEFGGEKPQPVIATLFRALTIAFSPRNLGASSPPWRSAAFTKRILLTSLHWAAEFTLQAIDFVTGLIPRYPKLEALLNTEERDCDGHYRAEIDDPQLCNPFGTSLWEVHILRRHWHPRVREAADKLARLTSS